MLASSARFPKQPELSDRGLQCDGILGFLERALVDPLTKALPFMWLAYMIFDCYAAVFVRHINHDAKLMTSWNIFYQSIESCGWSKVLWAKLLETLRGTMVLLSREAQLSSGDGMIPSAAVAGSEGDGGGVFEFENRKHFEKVFAMMEERNIFIRRRGAGLV